MVDLRGLITPEQYTLIDRYIETYAVSDESGNGSVHYERRASAYNVLAPWANAKGCSILGAMFKDSLIVSEQIKFHTPENEIYDMLDKDYRIREFESEYRNWVRNFEHGFDEEHNSEQWYDICDALWDLIRHNTIVANIYEGKTVKIPTGEGHDIVIAKGCKPVKMIGKLNAVFKISEKFEAYRIAVSLALNTKILKGNLCISIHPLDFMTMSDNDCDWDSCMSWRNFGSYRQGTVEMMNSPCVVVAYLAASEPMRIFGQEWNNKKWRSLFIVHPDFIGNVKGYPYQIPEIDKMVINKLKDMMAAAGFNAKYGEIAGYDHDEFIAENDRIVQLYFHTGYMYNDFGTITHYGCVREDEKKTNVINLRYSGDAECMWCGRPYDEETEEGLACSSCYNETRCDCCDERYHESSLIETGDGDWVCENCLCEYYSKSFENNEYYRTDSMCRVTVLPDQFKEAIEKEEIDPNKFDWDAPYILDHICGDLTYNDKWGVNNFTNRYLKKGAEIHFSVKSGWYGNRYTPYIFLSDMKDDWKQNFFDPRYGYCQEMIGTDFISQWSYLDYYFTDNEVAKKWIKTLSEESAA